MGGAARGVRAVALIAAIVAVTAWLVLVVWRSPHRGDLATFGAYAAAVVGLAGTLIRWAWRGGAGRSGGSAGTDDLDRLAGLLARAVEEQWARAAAEQGLQAPEPIAVRWGTPSLPLAGPVSAAVRSTRFRPLPGLQAVREERLRAGGMREDLHAIYGGLGSGRLIIAGRPGSGKTATAVLLVLAALRYREQAGEADRRRLPVPVLVTAHGWDPETQPVAGWLAGRLAETYELLAGRSGAARAGRLLAGGKLSVILDGLDEMPAAQLPVALRALSQQATFRLVILGRSVELAAAAAQSVLQGAAAVELRDVDAAAVASYLTSVRRDPPPLGWQELIARLRQDPAGPLARALSCPLTVSLVRDTYRPGEDVTELLHLSDRALPPATTGDIVDHLLDRVLPAAYSPRPGQPPPRYDLATAERTLRYLATRMNQDGTRDLLWWHIPAWQPASGPLSRAAGSLRALLGLRRPAAITGLAWAAVLACLAGVAAAPRAGLDGGVLAGVSVGVLAWLVVTPAVWLVKKLARLAAERASGTGRWGPVRLVPVAPGPPAPRKIVRVRPVPVARPPVLAFSCGVGLVMWPLGGPLYAFVATFLVLAGSVFAFRPASGDASPHSPREAWRCDRLAALVLPVMIFLFGSGMAGVNGPGFATAVTGIGLAVVLIYLLPGSATWGAAMAFVRLAVRERTPVRLIRFLEDARQRQVLRVVGPVYQFRHARLQDRLAAAEFCAEPGRGYR